MAVVAPVAVAQSSEVLRLIALKSLRGEITVNVPLVAAFCGTLLIQL
jgi:hypothetical protein